MPMPMYSPLRTTAASASTRAPSPDALPPSSGVNTEYSFPSSPVIDSGITPAGFSGTSGGSGSTLAGRTRIENLASHGSGPCTST